jgi:hypothetical protein
MYKGLVAVINKTLTKKLQKAMRHNGMFDAHIHIGKSSIGMYYVGDDRMMYVCGWPDNIFSTSEKAIQAALDGFRPTEVLYVI